MAHADDEGLRPEGYFFRFPSRFCMVGQGASLFSECLFQPLFKE